MPEAELDLRFRQIHLDFHTSPDIPDVGADFDPEEFALTLKNANVDSVTCFARCHHGHVYYQSKAFASRIHPTLARPDLLIEQIEACHRHGIKVPIYVTVQWDHFSAMEHPEWLCVDENAKMYGGTPLTPGFYQMLDVFHPGYRQFLFDHVKEIFEMMPVDGLFFDIVDVRPSLAPHWIQAMREEGVDINNTGSRFAFARRMLDDWKRDMTAFVRELSADATIFYNGGHVGPRIRNSADCYSHWELESLPSGGWGYLHFPQASRFARGLKKPFLGMTGKFHTSWGDFGSYKNPAALQFETFHMLSVGARCSIGDQLPPRGKLDAQTYELIGPVYESIASKQEFVKGAIPVVELAILTNEGGVAEQTGDAHAERNLNNILGAIRLFQELQIQFDIVDVDSDLFPYQVLVLPDDVILDAAMDEKVKEFLSGGGAVIASYRSGRLTGTGPMIDEFGVKLLGDAPFSPDFLVPRDNWSTSLPTTGHVMYEKGMLVDAGESEILADAEVPYFNRTWEHFCSHAHTPPSGKIGYPAIVRSGNVIYFAHPIFRQYFDNAPKWIKEALRDCLSLLLAEPRVEIKGPSSIITTLNSQEDEGRYILHVLHYIPERRGQKFDTIEDVIPLHNVECKIRVGGIKRVVSVPDQVEIPFELKAAEVNFTIPVVHGHSMIVLERKMHSSD